MHLIMGGGSEAAGRPNPWQTAAVSYRGRSNPPPRLKTACVWEETVLSNTLTAPRVTGGPDRRRPHCNDGLLRSHCVSWKERKGKEIQDDF